MSAQSTAKYFRMLLPNHTFSCLPIITNAGLGGVLFTNFNLLLHAEWSNGVIDAKCTEAHQKSSQVRGRGFQGLGIPNVSTLRTDVRFTKVKKVSHDSYRFVATVKTVRSRPESVPTVREKVGRELTTRPANLPELRTSVSGACDDCRARTAFHGWHDITMTPSYNWNIDFSDYNFVPAGRRAVIELVTAYVLVPAGEWIRLGLGTSLGQIPSNHHLLVSPQGEVGGQSIFVGTNSIRAYTDHDIAVGINRDNATTSGYALVSVSGYVV